MDVQVIEANELATSPALRADPPKLRVAAYCRVSTDSDEQQSSYQAQRAHYLTYIAEHPRWSLVDIFADEGISGTQANRRPEFQRMIAECRKHRIDLIITKSISRFARNTIDCLNYIRELKDLGIPVIFEKESINTMDASGEVLITILASLAQQESASISQNVKMGIRYIMREGRGRVNYAQFLGYTRGEAQGSLEIVPHEADVVRHIYRAYLEGYSPAFIASQLEDDCVPTPSGRGHWHASTVASILANEKYRGDLLMQKYFTPDYLTHRVERNVGQLPQYLVEGHHEPIVPREVFELVQDERLRRSLLRNDSSKLRFGRRQALAGRLVCGRCGRALKRCRRAGDGPAEWHCCERAMTLPATASGPAVDDCFLRQLSEQQAHDLILAAFNQLPEQYEELVESERLLAAEHARASVSVQRAELAHQAMQVRMLRELVGQMKPDPTIPSPSVCPPNQAACHLPEDFFARTQYQIPKGILASDGRMLTFCDALVIRYLDHVEVYDNRCEVMFKAGKVITVFRR